MGGTDTAILMQMVRSKREIESRLAPERTLEARLQVSGQSEVSGPLFEQPDPERRVMIMRDATTEVANVVQMPDKGSPWDADTKVSDDSLGSSSGTAVGNWACQT